MPRPHLEIYGHHPAATPHLLESWRTLAEAALPECLAAGSAVAPLPNLEQVEISLVSDEAIARVHAEFLQDPSPTDVITFHHGEILVSLDTALRQSETHRQPFPDEVLRYIIHGLLHLSGWEDHAEDERREMHAVQERILASTLLRDRGE